MLKKTMLMIGIAFCGYLNGQVVEKDEKDLTPGVLVCNYRESECLKGETGEQSSSILFSLFCDGHEDESRLFACKDCR